jgi:hypothetical protein
MTAVIAPTGIVGMSRVVEFVSCVQRPAADLSNILISRLVEGEILVDLR